MKQSVDEYLSEVAHFRTESMSDLLDIVEEDVGGESETVGLLFSNRTIQQGRRNCSRF